MSEQLLYSHENGFMVQTAKAYLQQSGIECFLRNEHSATMGAELGASNIWTELWLPGTQQLEQARKLLQQWQSSTSQADWQCPTCLENNSPAFELCWQCQTERP